MSAPEPLKIGPLVIDPKDQSPLVLALADMIQRQEAEIRELRDAIHKLKGTTRRPKIKPSKLLKPRPMGASDQQGRRPGSDKRHKTAALPIHEDLPLVIEGLPPGTQSEGYRDFVVQDLRIEAHNTRYRRTVYRLPDGNLQVASLPAHVEGHFGVRLRQYVLYQVHQNHVTQGRLLEELRELGIDISAGQISAILLAGHEALHTEKDALLPTARKISGYLHCDDTSARHRGHNAVCTHIGNELFASFHSTDSKSRLNFLQLLCLPEERYTWCEEAVQCLEWLGAGVMLRRRLESEPDSSWSGRVAWEAQLDQWGITHADHRTVVSEAALFGTLLTESWYSELGLISDDAPQFKLFGFLHGLCWVHGERKIDRLIPLTERQRQAKDCVQDEFWKLYDRLKAYRLTPTATEKTALAGAFDRMCRQKTGYPALNEALGLLCAKREGFLAVLEYPHLPLHNNLAENDIREYARLRKISAGTRSDLGRRCRDTFLSLKKTCRKLGIRFWEYLGDRLAGTHLIPPLAEAMRNVAQTGTCAAAAPNTG
jgi:hypothetical protein